MVFVAIFSAIALIIMRDRTAMMQTMSQLKL